VLGAAPFGDPVAALFAEGAPLHSMLPMLSTIARAAPRISSWLV